MKRNATRIAQLVGFALIVLILWLVGWNDRVTDVDGKEHVGRVRSVAATRVVLKTDDGEITIPIRDERSVSRGLAGAFTTLARNPWLLLGGVLVHLLGILCSFVRWHVLLRGADLATPLRHVLRLSWISNFLACVIPGGIASGDVARSVYIARTHDGRRTRAVVTVFFDRAVGLTALCSIAAVAVLVVPSGSRIEQVGKTIVLVLLGLGALGAVLLFSGRVQRALHLAKLLGKLPCQPVVTEIRHALAIYGRRPKTFVVAAGLSLAVNLLLLTGFFLYAKALGTDLPLLAVGAAIPVAQMLAAVPGLPGGWGMGDFAMFFFLPAVGVPAGQAVALSFVYRILHTLLSLPGGLMLADARAKED